MTRRIMLGGLLLTLSYGLLPAAAQPPVPVRDTSTVGVWEQLDLAVRRALVPWSVDVAPLHAYDPRLICEGDSEGTELAWHPGTAAIISGVDDVGGGRAFYHRTVEQAVEAAEQLCGRLDSEDWYFATTYPLAGTDATRHFMTRDVEGIAELLAVP